MGEAAAAQPVHMADSQVMQGDVVRAPGRSPDQLGWVCCITPENDEGHVYWQPHGGAPAADSREPLRSLQCADRALIPGDIVRRCDIAAGEGRDRGGRDRDAMGMVVGTEVLLDLLLLEADGQERTVRRSVPASSLRHLVPIRLATWAVHRADGWLGRIQSWDEDLVLRFPDRGAGSSRCRIRAANLKQGLAIAESFYRDFFPGLAVSISLQDFRSGALECEWLDGDATSVTAGIDAPMDSCGPPQKTEAVIEEVSIGAARVEWLAQVPLRRGLSSEQPPRSEGCPEDKLLFMLGEAECSARWALGDRLRVEGGLAEVCRVETFVDVRWQDDALSVRVPARELQLCNPDAFSFFPSELVCQRVVDEAAAVAGGPAAPPPACPCRPASPAPLLHGALPPPLTPASPSKEGGRGPAAEPEAAAAAAHAWTPGPGERGSSRREEQQPRVGFVLRADPASRMVSVRWLDEGGPSEEEEWSAFDLQIDPEFGYRLGDAVIRCRDWEEPAPSARSSPGSEEGVGPRVGQVAALESGAVRVRWLDGAVSTHAPRELYRVGDEDEGSMAESQDPGPDGAGAEGEGGLPAPSPGTPGAAPSQGSRAPTADLLDGKQGDGLGGEASTEEGEMTAGGQATEDDQSTGRSAGSEGAGAPAEPAGGVDANGGTTGTSPEVPRAARAAASSTPGQNMEVDADGAGDGNEVAFEDMAWEPLPTDHHFLHSPPHPPGPQIRNFTRRVQREWQILQRGLPRGVWVHVYPERMELLRACLAGPEGTPYADALFFFDVNLPPTYPQIPPQVRFWSFGENLNPNLYENGKVCLSLLGTWSGKDSETWSPERSNLLQVLVSILGLVLNTEPYYNEPGFERERDTPQGGLRSQRYNESVALSSYHLMLRVLRNGPCDFERLARRHFAERRAGILARARGLHSGDDGACSEGFRKSLAALLPRLEEALPEECPP